MFTILISSWQCKYSKKRLQFYRLESSAKSTANGQKPHLTKNGKIVLCKTEHFVPVVVPGLSSCSGASSSSTSFPQDSPSNCSSPASLRSDDVVSGNQRDHPKPKTEIKIRTPKRQRETACQIPQSGQRTSQIIWRMQKCQHPQTFLMTQIRNIQWKWHPGSTVFILTS